MWCSDRRTLLAGLGSLGLAGCGFAPLHAPGSPAEAIAGRVAVEAIDGSAGFAMRERLVTRLGPAMDETHRLAVSLRLDEVGVAITQQDVTSRFDVIAVATYALYPLGATEPVLTGETRAVTGYSAPSSSTASAFAILSARRDAEERLAVLLAERIARRLAIDAADWAP